MRGRFLLSLLVLSAPAFAQLLPIAPPPPPSSTPLLACPTGALIPSFGPTGESCGANGCTKSYAWSPPAGADANTIYDVYMATIPDYCSLALLSQAGTYSVVASTSGLAITVNPPRGIVSAVFVRVQGCSTQSQFSFLGDTFSTPPAKPQASVKESGAGQVTITYSRPDAIAGAILAIERADGGGSFQRLSAYGPQPYGNYCPASSQKTFVDQNVPPGSYRYRVVSLGNIANGYAQIPSDPVLITVGGGSCVAPPVPVLGSLPSSVASGRSISVSWSAGSANAASGVKYVLETSLDAFGTIASSQTSRIPSAVVTTSPSPTDYTLSFRAKAVADCGAESAPSASKALSVLKANATFLLTRSALELSGVVGLPPQPGFATFRNIGAVPGTLSLSAPPEGFVTVNPGSLSLAPGQEGTIRITPAASALTSEALYQGFLSTGSDSIRVSLTVAKGLYIVQAQLRPSASSVVFNAPPGQNPPPQTTIVNVVSDEPVGTVNLSPSIGPGGAWLSVGPSTSGGAPPPIPAGTPITLRVDRSRRSKDEGVAPFRTLIRFSPVGGDAETDFAVVEVIDNETGTVTTGAGGRGEPPDGRGSPSPWRLPEGHRSSSRRRSARPRASRGRSSRRTAGSAT